MMLTLGAGVIAAVAAILTGGSSVAQRRALTTVGTHDAGDLRLVAALARRGWWWAGTLAALGGLAAQILALAVGPLVTVQTIMTSSIVATTLIEWWLLGRRPTRRIWSGIALTPLGLVAALLALSPIVGGATTAPTTTAAVVGGGVCAAVIGGAVLLDRLGLRRRHRGGRAAPSTGLLLGVATGIGYGFTATQLKSIGTQLEGGWVEPLHHPAIYLAGVLGPLSILLSQNALQRSRRAVATVSVILVIDPLIGLVAGTAWFGDRVTTSPTALVVAGLAGLAALAGIAMTQAGAARTSRLSSEDGSDRPAADDQGEPATVPTSCAATDGRASASVGTPGSYPTPNRATSVLHRQ